jgi:O-antigen/teichoic acid export membrane protein
MPADATVARSTALRRISQNGHANALLLIASFGMGQGSIFLAQTLLVSRDAFDLLARFGVSFSFAILALMIVDCGSVTTIARRVSLADAAGRQAEIGRCYWAACRVRFCIAAIVATVGVGYALVSADPFYRFYILSAIPALFLWSFNAAGVFDGMQLSGISGATSVLAYLSSAFALVFAAHEAPSTAGLVLGAALSVGYAFAVAAQLAMLRLLGCLPRPVNVTRMQSLEFAREGGAVLLSVLPGQLSFRFQIVVCSLVLGEVATALFVYGRQIAAAASQVLEFVRRAHFAVLARNLLSAAKPFRAAFRTQRLAILLAVAMASGLLVGAAGCSILLDGALASAAAVVALFSVGILTGALAQTVAQAAQALGRYALVAWAMNTAMIACLVASAGLGWWLGLPGLATAEVLSHGVMMLCVCRPFRRITRATSVQVNP